eukprot:2174917-Pleurochrysis_carterae.AAC.1
MMDVGNATSVATFGFRIRHLDSIEFVRGELSEDAAPYWTSFITNTVSGVATDTSETRFNATYNTNHAYSILSNKSLSTPRLNLTTLYYKLNTSFPTLSQNSSVVTIRSFSYAEVVNLITAYIIDNRDQYAMDIYQNGFKQIQAENFVLPRTPSTGTP